MPNTFRSGQLSLTKIAIAVIAALVLVVVSTWGALAYRGAQAKEEALVLHDDLYAVHSSAEDGLEKCQDVLADNQEPLKASASTSKRLKDNKDFFAKKGREEYQSAVTVLSENADVSELPAVEAVGIDADTFAREFRQADKAQRVSLKEDIESQTAAYRELSETYDALRSEFEQSLSAVIDRLLAVLKQLPSDADRLASDHKDAKKDTVSKHKKSVEDANKWDDLSVEERVEQLEEMHALVKTHVTESMKVVDSHASVVAERERAAQAAARRNQSGSSGSNSGGSQRMCNVWRWAPVGGGYMALEPC